MLHLNIFCILYDSFGKLQAELYPSLLADLRSLSMLLSGTLQPRHNVRNPARPQEGVETAGVCGPRGQCDLPFSRTQERPSPRDGRRGQEGQSLGSWEAKLYHESVRSV